MSKLSFASLIAALCLASYFLGRSQSRIEYIERKITVYKNVQQQTAKIYAAPNAERTALLELMQQEQL